MLRDKKKPSKSVKKVFPAGPARREGGFPILGLLRQDVPNPLAMPHGIIGVLQFQLLIWVFLAASGRAIEGALLSAPALPWTRSWSMGVLERELSALYGAFAGGQEDPLPELELQYADYAVWHRKWIENVLPEQAEYWKTALAGAPALLEIPTDHARRAEQDYRGAFVQVVLDQELTAALKELSQRHGATLFMTLLAGWGALLARLSGQDDVVIGVPAANRGRKEVENLIGFFVNTLAMRLELSGSPTASELLQRVKACSLSAQQHQDIPFDQVVESVRPLRSPSFHPVFQVMFVWESASSDSLNLPGIQAKRLPRTGSASTEFDLTLVLREEEGWIAGELEYAAALFKQETIERYWGYFRRLLQEMAAAEDQAIDRLPIVGHAERKQLLYEWNATERDFPRDKCAHELFEEQAEKNREAAAVVHDGRELTYGELNLRANRLAHHLRAMGVRPDARVAICMERGFEMFEAVLAVLKAGGAYVPLDPEHPAERLSFMLQDSEPEVVLTQGHLRSRLEALGAAAPILDLNENSLWRNRMESNPDRCAVGLKPEHLAYMIYTSGSTGQPKGAMVEHRPLCNLLFQRALDLCVKPGVRMSQFVSFSFDAWVEEALTALAGGASLYLVGSMAGLQVEALSKIIDKYAITHVLLPPTLLAVLVEHGRWESVRIIVVGGSRLSAETARRWGPGRRLVNEYGPTEATVCATFYECRGDEASDPPIGRPMANARIYILDRHQEPVPTGVAGEIYIGGLGVARGYWKRQEQTARQFLLDPFVKDGNARMYKTGDLGRWLGDGNVEFIGRNDNQVKIRGFRIELDEIKARLQEHADVREAAVVARNGSADEKRLVAYYTCGQESADPGAEPLRTYLAGKLPEHMVPAAYVRLETIPLTSNGKLDLNALPEPEGKAYAVREYEAPAGEVEEALAEIWSELLGVERVGRNDNFFALGGHSILAVQVVARLRQRLGLEIGLQALFAAKTLAMLAANARSEETVPQVPPNKIPKLQQSPALSWKDIEITI